MPRLIDSDKLMVWFDNYYDFDEFSVGYISGIIREQPTIDAVEVVRCNDCKFYDTKHPYGTLAPDAYHCKTNDRFYSADHFCAYGERKDDAEIDLCE